MEKMTKKDYFAQIRAIVAEHGTAEQVAFIDHEVDLLGKKNAKRSNAPTKAQKENASYGDLVLNVMENDTKYTVTEIQGMVAELKDLSNQRATAIMRALVKAGSVVRVEEKGKAYFMLA